MSEVGVTSFIDFSHRCKFAADTVKKSENNCFFGDKIPHLESVFLEIGLRSSVAVPH